MGGRKTSMIDNENWNNQEHLRDYIKNEVMFTSEACEYLGISPQRMHQLVQAGKIQPVKIAPAGMLFLREDLEERRRVLSCFKKTGNLKQLKINNDPVVVQRAINYYTIQHLCKYSDKKAEAVFAEISKHVDINKSLIRGEVARILNVNVARMQEVYDWVTKSFEALEPDDYIVEKGHELYPQRLALTEHAPLFLFMRGNPALANLPAVAVVGTRNPSPEGKEKAKVLASLLGSYQIVVVSGLAAGIDRAAHEGALESETPTIAVIGTPLTRCYPQENTELQNEVAKKGLIISQFPPSSPTRKWHFPLRNATMSGICLATIVVEAGETSGALIQADYALKQGRLVFIPQSAVDNPKLNWPRKYAEKKGVYVFSRIYELTEKLQEAQIIDNNSAEKEESLPVSRVKVHYVCGSQFS